MNDQEFKKEYFCDFTPSKREIALANRIAAYYESTPDSMPNRYAVRHWHSFIQWCNERGYTRDEINKAKLNEAFNTRAEINNKENNR